GEVGRPEVVAEERVEAVLPRSARASVVAALLAAHPYEEPAHDVVELADPGLSGTGTGRVGDVDAMTLEEFAQRVASALPRTAGGVRVAGDSTRTVRRVALVGGAGDFLLDSMARSDADVYVTSDLRHHPASEFIEKGGPALVDVAHWAAEWTWLPVVEALLRESLGSVEPRGSTLNTDSWTMRLSAKRETDVESRPVRPAQAAGRAVPGRPRRPAPPPADHPARDRRDRRADRDPHRAGGPDARPADRRRRPHRRPEEGRRRRRAGQDPPRPRPGPD